MTEPTQAVAPKKKTIQDLVVGYKPQFAAALPKCITPDRFVRVALTCFNITPRLRSCTPESLITALIRCAQFGLEPDGRRAHLIPYGDEATLLIDYKGLAELAMRSNMVSNIHADIVCENDEFEYDRGRLVKHRIDFKKDRGLPYAAYSFVQMKDGTESCAVMSKSEIEEIRDNFSMGWRKDKAKSPWGTRPYEMWKKTVFRSHSKWLPLSSEFRDAVDEDADDPAGIKLAADVEVLPPVGTQEAPPASTAKARTIPEPPPKTEKPKTEPRQAPQPQQEQEAEPEPEQEPAGNGAGEQGDPEPPPTEGREPGADEQEPPPPKKEGTLPPPPPPAPKVRKLRSVLDQSTLNV